MSLKHVNNNLWTKLTLGCYASSLVFGLYGRTRSDFSNEFTFNVSLPYVLMCLYRNITLEFW